MATFKMPPEDQHAFVLAGLPGCGKSTAAQKIVRELQMRSDDPAVSTEVSDYVRALFKAANDDDVNDNELGRWAAEQKREHGNDYFVRGMAELWHGDDKPHAVISGVRSPAEAEAVRDVFGPEHTTVIAIWTLPDKRFKRKYGDKVSKDHPKWETFQERNEREIHEWGCVDFFVDPDLTDYIVTNNNTIAALKIDLRTIVYHDVYDDSMPPSWNEDFYPFPRREREVVAQYL